MCRLTVGDVVGWAEGADTEGLYVGVDVIGDAVGDVVIVGESVGDVVIVGEIVGSLHEGANEGVDDVAILKIGNYNGNFLAESSLGTC